MDVMKKERPGLKFLVFDAKQSPTDNYNTWSAQVKAHPDAVAYVGPGSQAAVSLARIQRKRGQEAARRRLRPRPGRDAGRQGRLRLGAHLARALAQGLPRDQAAGRREQSGKELPEGCWNSGALTVNRDNIDEIIARQKDAASRAAYFKDEVAKQLANPGPVPQADAEPAECSKPRTPQVLRRRRRAGRRGLHGPRRLGARAAGGERGRQVDARQDHRGRRAAGRRRRCALDGQRVSFVEHRAGRAQRRRGRLAGAEPVPGPRRAREPVPDARDRARAVHRSGREMAARRGPCSRDLGLDVSLRTPVGALVAGRSAS